MMLTAWFKQKASLKSAAARLYQAAVVQSRDPVFYERLGVADTMDGRFDLVSLHVFLIIHRTEQLGKVGQKLSQALLDRMFKTMDLTLREIGVGDLGVPKHMKKMMKAFNGRSHAYHLALQNNDIPSLELAVTRNIFRSAGESIPAGTEPLAQYILRTRDAFAACELASFMEGTAPFPFVLTPTKESAYA